MIGPYLPDILRHRGVPLDFIISDMYLTTTGIFGIPLGVSTDFVFLFVLFGALLDKAGGGKYFIDIAFSTLGHLSRRAGQSRGDGLGLTGMVSGSSIANTVTTGTFTIPLMKRRTARLQGRGRRSRRVHQRAVDAPDHGRRRLHHGRDSRPPLSRCGAGGASPGAHLLSGAVLRRPHGIHEAGHQGHPRSEAAAFARTFVRRDATFIIPLGVLLFFWSSCGARPSPRRCWPYNPWWLSCSSSGRSSPCF
jgi:hypothetical protein